MVPHTLNLVKRDVGNAALPITFKKLLVKPKVFTLYRF